MTGPAVTVRIGVEVGVDEFDVLAGDQRQQPDRVGRRPRRHLAQRLHDSQSIADQSLDQLLAGLLVVPGDLGFAMVVVMRARHPRHHLDRAGTSLRTLLRTLLTVAINCVTVS